MAKYTITTSIPYRAQSPAFATLPIHKDPWLHCLLCSICKTDAQGKRQVAWYALTYIWDTREVVDWVDITDKRYGGFNDMEKALDNDKPLKDPKKLVATWTRNRVCQRRLSKCTAETFEV